MKLLSVYLAATALMVAMTGCSKSPDPAAPASTDAPPSDVAAPAPADSPQAPAVKLTADQVSIKLTLESEPRVNAASGVVEFTVKVENNGKVALSGASNPPVNLGVQIEGPDGTAEGMVRDFSRTTLPEIAPGAAESIAVQVPADARIDGRKLKVDLVQESVSWFSDFGQPTLEVGPIQLDKK